MKIIQKYFGFEEEADSGMAPATDGGGQFAFGAPEAPQGGLFFGCVLPCFLSYVHVVSNLTHPLERPLALIQAVLQATIGAVNTLCALGQCVC